MKQKTNTPDYKAENETIKKAYEVENDFIKDELLKNPEKNQKANIQNLQSDMEKTVEK